MFVQTQIYDGLKVLICVITGLQTSFYVPMLESFDVSKTT